MKTILSAGGALLLTTSLAYAGGLDRSGQPVGVIFEDGTYAELSFGYVMPSITGQIDSPFLGGISESGNIGVDYTQIGAGFKTDFGNNLSGAIILDQPYGAAVDYDDTDPTYPAAPASARVNSTGLTALLRYEMTPNFSVHGGLRQISADGEYTSAGATYDAEYETDSDTAYVVGAAYERDEIAMRVALTYTSAVDLELDGNGTFGPTTLTANLPESINLDFQTGIAADTLLFGSIRYVAWDGTQLVDTTLNTLSPGNGVLVDYENDVYTYNIGVGRRFTEAFSGSVSIGYEAESGEEFASNLSPTDGNISFAVGGAYTMPNGVEISGGVRYVRLGDATTSFAPLAPFEAEFEDNSAIAVGMKIAYTF